MVTTRHDCARCDSEHIRRNGHSGSHARYQCKACGYQARVVPVAAVLAHLVADAPPSYKSRAYHAPCMLVTPHYTTARHGTIRNYLKMP